MNANRIRFEPSADGTLYVPHDSWTSEVDWDNFPDGYEAYSFLVDEYQSMEYEDVRDFIDHAYREYYKYNPRRDGGIYGLVCASVPLNGKKSLIVVIKVYK
jgi:hypothetical protein